jgi:methyl-accepting chemotaxis protein
MNKKNLYRPENIADYTEDINKFSFTFIASTEFISYFLIVPLLFIYIVVNLDLSFDQLVDFMKITSVAFTVSFITTMINDFIVIAPIVRYFKTVLNGGETPQEEYKRVQLRFFNLPYIHGVGAFFRWVLGLSMPSFPFFCRAPTVLFSSTMCGCSSPWSPPSAPCCIFFSLSCLSRSCSPGGFPVIAIDAMSFSMNFVKRIIISILTIYLVPVVAIIGYFFLVLEHPRPGEYFSLIKLAGIIFFGIAVALTLGIALIKTIRVKIAIIVDFVNTMATGDFSRDKTFIAVMDELTKVNQSLGSMKSNVEKMLHDVRDASERLTLSTGEISSITGSFSSDTQNQAATVEEVTATMEEVSASLVAISSGAQDQIRSVATLSQRINELAKTIHEMERMTSDARELAVSISRQVKTGGESLTKMDESMEKISQSSQKMTAIIGIINDISDKINLLSLNASIEAARAGDAGRGFAVVADEISKLADNTATSVKEIDLLIKNSDEQIVQGKTHAAEVVRGMAAIIEGVERINTMALGISGYVEEQIASNRMVDEELKLVRVKSEDIERSTAEQKKAMAEVVEAVSRINELTQSISSGAEEIAANSAQIAGMADEQKSMVERFKLRS